MQMLRVSYQSSAPSILHTLGTRTQSTILTQAAGCLAILCSKMQRRASCFSPSKILASAACVLINVWLLSERPECITCVKHARRWSWRGKIWIGGVLLFMHYAFGPGMRWWRREEVLEGAGLLLPLPTTWLFISSWVEALENIPVTYNNRHREFWSQWA